MNFFLEKKQDNENYETKTLTLKIEDEQLANSIINFQKEGYKLISCNKKELDLKEIFLKVIKDEKLYNLFFAEFRTEFTLNTRYLLNYVTLWFCFTLLFLGVYFGINYLMVDNPISSEKGAEGVISFSIWFLCFQIINFTTDLSNKIFDGVIEQMFISPFNVKIILFSQIISSFIYNAIGVSILFIILKIFTKSDMILSIYSIPILIILFSGIIGLVFFLCGIILIYKSIGAFHEIISFILLALSMDYNLSPFLPMGPIVLLKKLIVYKYNEIYLIISKEFLISSLTNIGFFILGILVFDKLVIYCMKKGILSEY